MKKAVIEVGGHRFSWNWKLSELNPDKDINVFTTFSCGGGSSMGYKRAGFHVIGNVEIDPKINAMYVLNHHPKFNYNMDLRKFNSIPNEDLPEELFHLDILDGSPPCSTFSSAGPREKNWGKAKAFREGQKKQILDDLFFVFLDTVEKLQPKVVIAENVMGLIRGKAKGYVNLIIKRFKELGYDVQIFALNSARMDVPQARHRVFFVANRMGYPKLSLKFNYDLIPFEKVRSEHGVPLKDGGVFKTLVDKASQNDMSLEDVYFRITGKMGSYFTAIMQQDRFVAPTITASANFYRYCDRSYFSDQDFANCQTFPQDYNFNGNNVQYVCGMSVPPNMMANIATEVYEQWLA